MAQAQVPPSTVPGVLKSLYPCVDCLSQEEQVKLLAFLLYVLQNAGDTDVDSLITGAKCFKCYSVPELLTIVINSLIALAVANGYFEDAADAMEAAKCLRCVDPATIYGAIAKATVEQAEAQYPET